MGSVMLLERTFVAVFLVFIFRNVHWKHINIPNYLPRHRHNPKSRSCLTSSCRVLSGSVAVRLYFSILVPVLGGTGIGSYLSLGEPVLLCSELI